MTVSLRAASLHRLEGRIWGHLYKLTNKKQKLLANKLIYNRKQTGNLVNIGLYI